MLMEFHHDILVELCYINSSTLAYRKSIIIKEIKDYQLNYKQLINKQLMTIYYWIIDYQVH